LAKAKQDAVVEGTAVEEGAEEFKPAPGELAVRPDVPDDAFRAMDAWDEVQILDALMGRPSEKLVYSFKGKDGKPQNGLSYEGVGEVVRELNANRHTAIRVSESFAPVLTEVQEENEQGEVVTYIQALVYAEDELNRGGNYGIARQAKFQVYKDKSRKPTLDPYATTKALSKAQRNAMKPLTPVVFREALIAKMLNNPQRVQHLMLGMGDATAEMPPPLTDDRADELRKRIRAVYSEIKGVDPMALLPGQFNAKLRRVEHEHAAMEELLAALEAQLAHLRETAGAS
jgi:hypothetical protein